MQQGRSAFNHGHFGPTLPLICHVTTPVSHLSKTRDHNNLHGSLKRLELQHVFPPHSITCDPNDLVKNRKLLFFMSYVVCFACRGEGFTLEELRFRLKQTHQMCAVALVTAFNKHKSDLILPSILLASPVVHFVQVEDHTCFLL